MFALYQDKTNRTIYYTYLAPRPIFQVENELFYSRAPMMCTFPSEGSYTVQVWFFQDIGNDVLKGEISLLVKTEVDSHEE
jgi:hypothetical protein